MKRSFDLGDCLDGAQISLAYEARRALPKTDPAPPAAAPPPSSSSSPDAMAALVARMERTEASVETLTRLVNALVAPDCTTTPPILEATEPEAQPEAPEPEAAEPEAPKPEAPEPELLPTFASEAPTTSETPPRCATPDPLDMLSPEQAMLASLLNGGALDARPPPPAPPLPAQPPQVSGMLQPPPLPPPSDVCKRLARGPPGILSEYGGVRGWMAARTESGGGGGGGGF